MNREFLEIEISARSFDVNSPLRLNEFGLSDFEMRAIQRNERDNSDFPHMEGLPPQTRHVLDPTLSPLTNETDFRHLYLSFSVMISTQFITSSVESGFAMFEQLRQQLEDNFEGEELEIRLAALEAGFLRAAERHATMVAGNQMVESGYTPEQDGVELTREQLALNARLRQSAANLSSHITGMFRAALAFYFATGSFVGFFDTPEANMPGMMSMNDVATISTRMFTGSSSADASHAG
jgi:hypothetical protein